jgi:predicted nucleotidyltransferase
VVTLEQLRGVYREQILAFAEREGVEEIRVFGSVARGQQTDDSDVDFLYRAGDHVSLWEIGGLQSALEELLQTKVQLTDEWSVEHHALPDERAHIFSEAVAL